MIDSEERELKDALSEKAILDMYASGDDVTVIAMMLGTHVQAVHGVIRKAATVIRDANKERVEAAFLQQDRGIQHLIRCCMSRLSFEGKPVFNADAIRCLIMVYDRQAKLHGLDKAKIQMTVGAYSWLETASPEMLMEKARAMGIRVPEPFTTLDA